MEQRSLLLTNKLQYWGHCIRVHNEHPVNVMNTYRIRRNLQGRGDIDSAHFFHIEIRNDVRSRWFHIGRRLTNTLTRVHLQENSWIYVLRKLIDNIDNYVHNQPIFEGFRIPIRTTSAHVLLKWVSHKTCSKRYFFSKSNQQFDGTQIISNW